MILENTNLFKKLSPHKYHNNGHCSERAQDNFDDGDDDDDDDDDD